MNAKELGETLKTLVASGKDLREAGYTRIEIDGIKLELADAETPAAPVPATAAEESSGNPLDDPDTFGGHLPQRRTARRIPECEE